MTASAPAPVDNATSNGVFVFQHHVRPRQEISSFVFILEDIECEGSDLCNAGDLVALLPR